MSVTKVTDDVRDVTAVDAAKLTGAVMLLVYHQQ